jgi:hypothetical protein
MVRRDFWRNTQGSSFENLALAVAVIAVVFVAGADLLNHASQPDGFLARAFANHKTDVAQKSPDAARDGVDYTATGSIIGLRRPIMLDPCTGNAKQ